MRRKYISTSQIEKAEVKNAEKSHLRFRPPNCCGFVEIEEATLPMIFFSFDRATRLGDKVGRQAALKISGVASFKYPAIQYRLEFQRQKYL
jgi:hypothetical protein